MNSIRIFPGWTSKPYAGLKEGRRVRLENNDLEATEKYFPDYVISAGATVRQSNVNVSFGQEYVNISLMGVHPNYTEVETVKTADGRFVNQNDLKERRKVIVIHKKTADILFGKTHTEPIGQFVNASGVAYQVVGIYNDQGDREASEAYIPFSTLQTIYNKGEQLNNIIFTTKNLETIESNEIFEANYRRVIGQANREIIQKKLVIYSFILFLRCHRHNHKYPEKNMLIPSNRTKRECILSRLCFLVLSVWVSLPSAAQNNPYKIDDALYPIYQRASKQARQQEGLLVADTLYQQALKLGDKKAQCLAYIIPLQFYISQKDDSKIEKASTDLKEISRANNYLQYYYHAWSSEIIYFLNQQRSLLALQKAEKMKKQAFADRYPYGIFSCIRTMGHIYKSRGNFDLSAQYYQEALDYMLKNMPDQDPSQLYSSLAEYYRNTQKDYATALDYCEKALKSAKTERNIAQAMIEKCLILFKQKRIDEFNDCYKEAVQMADRCKLSANVSLLIAHISKNILDKQYEQAHAHADQLSEKGLQQHAYIYECAKDYPNAIKYLKKYHQQLDSTNNLLQLSDIAELNTQIGAERLKMENIQATSRYRITLFSIVTGFLLLSLLFLMLYPHRKRKVNLELCHKNEELSEARDQAEAANKAKSIFLQNMSHEIRTPLNSIVGFSQLITSPDANLSQEERQDFCHLIQHNSDLLLTLVGDILSAAELESNRYTMKIAPHSCNKLCREAITTVEHRKPEGVKLYYTSEVDDCYELSTDGQRVCQILINFLTNAEKHTTQGEIRLHCSLTENPGYVTFSVTDTGTGIPPEYSETIFERFEKADNFGQGTGLGLNICRLIAERLKGKVLLDKEYKEGARFVFVLPVKKSI